MKLIIKLVTGEEFIVDKSFPANKDGAAEVRSSIKAGVGIPLSPPRGEGGGEVLRIWPNPDNVAYVGIRSDYNLPPGGFKDLVTD